MIGSPGREVAQSLLPGLKRRLEAGLAIVNGENAAAGFGLTRDAAAELFAAGADVLTGGNHLWDRRESLPYLAEERRLVRPANLPPGTPGRGWGVFKAADGTPVGIVNLLGRVFMKEADDPFRAADQAVEALRSQCRVILVDFHAETTAEKMALAWHLDGRVSAVVGTHTHVQTADERVLPGGTAFLTDAGMTGGFDSVIGMEKEAALRRFLTQMPERLSPAGGNRRLNAVAIEVDPATGKARGIERLQVAESGAAAPAPSAAPRASAASARAPGPGARRLRGDAPAGAVRAAARAAVTRLRAAGVVPVLALVSVGDDPASGIYLARKSEACAEAGIGVRRVTLAAGADTRTVVERVRELGRDPEVHGVLVQLPLPPPAEARDVLEAVPPEKDVDGFHPLNLGRLSLGLPGFVPATPRGILELLRHHEVPLAGRHAVMLGRSAIVGRPLSILLSARGVDMTVTLGHSASGPGLAQLARQADLLVAAIGKPGAVTGEWVKPGATVVDVGIHRVPDPAARGGQRLVGDCDAASVAAVAGALTPVPGGVGPMTVAMLVSNVVLAAERLGARVKV